MSAQCTWVCVPRGIPDVPYTHNCNSPVQLNLTNSNTFNIEGDNIKQTAFISNHCNLQSLDRQDSNFSDESESACSEDGEAIEFSTEVAPGVRRQWFARVVNLPKGRALIIDLDKCDWHNGSKESFIRVLECADECLDCTHVFVAASRATANTLLMRTFLFLGFKLLAPSMLPVGVNAETHICLACDL